MLADFSTSLDRKNSSDCCCGDGTKKPKGKVNKRMKQRIRIRLASPENSWSLKSRFSYGRMFRYGFLTTPSKARATQRQLPSPYQKFPSAYDEGALPRQEIPRINCAVSYLHKLGRASSILTAFCVILHDSLAIICNQGSNNACFHIF